MATPEQARTLAAEVKAEHADNSYGGCCGCRHPYDEDYGSRDAPWPCPAYRLAETVETLAARLEQPWTGWRYVGADDGTADPP